MTLRVAALYRYPVKSMLGEQLDSIDVTARGLAGDRAFAVVDSDTGIVASAKQPRKWGWMLQCAAVAEDGHATITLPDGRRIRADAPGIDRALSALAHRPVTLSNTPPPSPHLERLWPDVDGLAPPDVIERRGTVTPMAAGAPGTFFDYAPLHIVTVATLGALDDADAARFRPNIVLDGDNDAFAENRWGGARIAIGDITAEVVTVTPRCAVPSLAHGRLPADLQVLRRVVARNRIPVGEGRFACAGVYAGIAGAGVIRVGDEAVLDATGGG